MHILVRSADLLQSSAIYLAIILMIRNVSIMYVLRNTQKGLRALARGSEIVVLFSLNPNSLLDGFYWFVDVISDWIGSQKDRPDPKILGRC